MGSSSQDFGNEQEKSCCKRSYEDIIATLPKETAGMTDYFQYQGFWYDHVWTVGLLWAQENFHARNTDIILASFPKCGTTWLKALMFAIANRSIYDSSSHPLLTSSPHKSVPCLDLLAHEKDPIPYLNSLPPPRLLSTHLAFSSLPKSIIDSGSKIIYICRNPRDVVVSYWKFMNNVRSSTEGHGEVLTLEEFFEHFCKGMCLSGPFWEHNLGFWRASQDNPENVLFLKYEDMKDDAAIHVKKLAEFMGCPFTAKEENGGAVEEIVKLCSMENLSKLEVNKSGIHSLGSETSGKFKNSNFFRNGTVGDSKNYLPLEMTKRLDEITQEKLSGSGLKF